MTSSLCAASLESLKRCLCTEAWTGPSSSFQELLDATLRGNYSTLFLAQKCLFIYNTLAPECSTPQLLARAMVRVLKDRGQRDDAESFWKTVDRHLTVLKWEDPEESALFQRNTGMSFNSLLCLSTVGTENYCISYQDPNKQFCVVSDRGALLACRVLGPSYREKQMTQRILQKSYGSIPGRFTLKPDVTLSDLLKTFFSPVETVEKTQQFDPRGYEESAIVETLRRVQTASESEPSYSDVIPLAQRLACASHKIDRLKAVFEKHPDLKSIKTIVILSATLYECGFTRNQIVSIVKGWRNSTPLRASHTILNFDL